MVRWASAAFIAAYLGALSYGLVAHTTGYHPYKHMGMYFVVWDMFCGWTGWETRNHIVAEGESGTYYDLGATPWGQMKLYGDTTREHYDTSFHHSYTLARNTAAHTDHEPLTRYLVIEEAWAKKYNLPDALWAQRLDEPKELRSYHRVRLAYDHDGTLLVSNPSWHTWLTGIALSNNPRLIADMKRGQPHMTADSFARSPSVVLPVGYERSGPPPRFPNVPPDQGVGLSGASEGGSDDSGN
jgi:hypothetical protein